MDKKSPLSPLEPIGKGIYYFEDTEPQTENRSSSPNLIILCTWLGGATPQRVQKYIIGYRALYPSSAILVIASDVLEMSALPFSAIRARLAPARDVVRQVINAGTGVGSTIGNSGILLHLFSNGGCNTGIQLAVSLRTGPVHLSIDIGQHLGGIIFDSCPGVPSFQRFYETAALSLPPSGPARAVGSAVMYPFMGVVFGLQSSGWMSSSRDMYEQLNDPGLLGETAARLYMYSTTDQVFGQKDFETHLAQARAKLRCIVEGVPFPNSPHCAIVRDHPGRYWTEIKRFWMGTETIPEMPGVDFSYDSPRSRL